MHFLKQWKQDRLLQGVVRNSSYLFSSNTLAIALSMLQGIFAARLLGKEGFGILAASVIPLVSNIHRLLSFRMSELVVKYLGEYLPNQERERAGALVKAAGLAEALTSLAAFALLMLAAPLAAQYLVKQAWTVDLFRIYGLVLLGNLLYETSSGVLHSFRRFDRISQVNLVQSLLTAGLIFLAFLRQGEMLDVLLAYLAGKTLAGAALFGLAWRTLRRELGGGWWRASLSRLPPLRELAHFALNTNLQGTVNLVVRDSETLLITWLRSPVEAGYFKIAQGVINLVMLPIEPFIATTYAEISRTIGQKQYALTQSLLKRVSAISGAWTLAAGGGLALLGWWLVPLLYGQEYAPAYPALLALLVGYGLANSANWNRPLLLALGMPGFPLVVAALAGAVKTGLTCLVTPAGGYVAEAALVSAYLAVSVGIILWRGLSELSRRRQSLAAAEAAP